MVARPGSSLRIRVLRKTQFFGMRFHGRPAHEGLEQVFSFSRRASLKDVSAASVRTVLLSA